MSYIGSLGEELLRAFGRSAATARVRFHSVADAALTRHGPGDKARDELRRAVKDDPAIMIEALEEIKFLDPILTRVLERRLAAMRALGVHIPVGHVMRDSQKESARRDKDSAGHDVVGTQRDGARATESGGQIRDGAHSVGAPASHGSRAAHPSDARGGQCSEGAQRLGAHASDNRAGHDLRDSHESVARPVVNPPRGLSAMKGAAAVVKRCVLDMIEVNGQKLRDTTPDEALRWADAMAGRATTVRRICAGLAPLTPIGKQLSDEEAEQRAADKVAA